MNPRSVIRTAATQAADAQRKLEQAVAAAYGAVPVTEIAALAGVTRPTIYAWLAEQGVTLKNGKEQQ